MKSNYFKLLLLIIISLLLSSCSIFHCPDTHNLKYKFNNYYFNTPSGKIFDDNIDSSFSRYHKPLSFSENFDSLYQQGIEVEASIKLNYYGGHVVSIKITSDFDIDEDFKVKIDEENSYIQINNGGKKKYQIIYSNINLSDNRYMYYFELKYEPFISISNKLDDNDSLVGGFPFKINEAEFSFNFSIDVSVKTYKGRCSYRFAEYRTINFELFSLNYYSNVFDKLV